MQTATPKPPSVKTLLGHPIALFFPLFTTEMWERFNYYGMRAILILFMTKALDKGGLGWSQEYGSVVYGWFTGIVYLTTIFGGFIADNYLGRRNSINIGGLLMMLGQFTLAFGPNETTFFLGLGLICIGNGLFKPNISTMVGALYDQQDARRDSAFTIFYMGINSGVILSAITGWLEGQESLGARWGFAACGIAMATGLVIMWIFGDRFLGDLGKEPEARRVQSQRQAAGEHKSLTDLTRVEWERIIVLLVIFLYATMFWLGFEQAGSSMNLYTRDYINRTVFGYEIPTGIFQSVNSTFIVLFGPVFAWLWIRLSKAGKEPRTPIKMALGLILMGVGFLCLVGAVNERGGDIADTTVKASLIWLIGAYFFHTMGELCLSPVGLSVFTKLAPAQFGSLMMGVWFAAVGAANVIGGYVAAAVHTAGAGAVFSGIAWSAIGLGVLAILLSPILNRMMHGVH